MQYGLEERRQDFLTAFTRVVDAAVELRVNFFLIAGDLFDSPRPSSATLTSVISELKRLKEKRIPVLAVNGSHDTSQTSETSILTPLDKAELLRFLPLYGSAGWSNDECYVYGLFNYSSRFRLVHELPTFIKENPPSPGKAFNICVLHQGIEWPDLSVPYAVEIRPEELPAGFQYYASGHLHHHVVLRFKQSKSLFVYPGATETKDVREAEEKKGFCYVQVQSKDRVEIEHEEIPTRNFVKVAIDCGGLNTSEITERAVRKVRELDSEGCILTITLEGVLPRGFQRYQVDMNAITSAKRSALYVQVLNHLREAELASVARKRAAGPRDLHERILPYLEQFVDNSGTHLHHSDNADSVRNEVDAVWQILEVARRGRITTSIKSALAEKLTELAKTAPPNH